MRCFLLLLFLCLPAKSASGLALSPNGKMAAAVNPDSGSISFISLPGFKLLKEVPVGKGPRSVAFTADSRFVVTANRDSADVSVVDVSSYEEIARIRVGRMPTGIAVDGARVYVSLFAQSEIAVIDLDKKKVRSRIAVESFPAGLSVGPSGSRSLFVVHFRSGRVSWIDMQSGEVRSVADAGPSAGLAETLFWSEDYKRFYLPRTAFNNENPALTFDSTIFPIVDALRLEPFGIVGSERLHLAMLGRPVNRPYASVVDGARGVLYISHSGSNDVTAINLQTGLQLARRVVGANPAGIALTADGSRLLVNNILDGTLSILQTPGLTVAAVVPLTRLPLAKKLLQGKKLFHSSASPRLTRDRWISCATCHPGGGADGRTWAGFPDGARNTPLLFGAAKTLPAHWSGGLDELHDVELTIRVIQVGMGLSPSKETNPLGRKFAGTSRDLDALVAYLESLEAPAPPPASETAAKGKKIFDRLDCARCHRSPFYSDAQNHDVGTGGEFDTPSLLSLWFSAPYLHDGSAATLMDVFSRGAPHEVAAVERPDLRSYLFSF